MRVLLLGGTGAMGISLMEILANQGNEVDVTSRKNRISTKENIHYICGNAHDDGFLNDLLKRKYDAIVDFMIYTTDEFEKRYKRLLQSTAHYIFLSSSRVYANSDSLIKEDSDRLLDVCKDSQYLATDEYALSKARQENYLFLSKNKNYTIVRPYITYNSNRLQLGVLEKEYWLQRALNGKTIIFQNEISTRKTTLTYGYDVAVAISILIGNHNSYGEAFHITGEESLLWKDVLDLYKEVLISHNVHNIRIIEEPIDDVARLLGCYYQIHYDRLYNREFDNSKIKSLCGNSLSFTPISVGLSQSLSSFLKNPEFLYNNLLWEAHCDGVAREKKTMVVDGFKNNIKYFIFRNTPRLGRIFVKTPKKHSI